MTILLTFQIPDVFYQYRIRKGSITKQGFKPKKMDLMLQSIELKMYIENNYPNLLKQANKFVCINLTNLMTLLIGTEDSLYVNEKKEVKRKSCVYLRENILNHYFSLKDKLRMFIKILQIS